MKKYAVFAALLALGAALAGAESEERSIHAIGVNVPIWNHRLPNIAYLSDEDFGSGDFDLETFAVGVDFMYHHLKVRESRFSSFVDVEFGYSNFKPELDGKSFDSSDFNLDGFNTRFGFGLGGAPLVNDFVTLAVHGTFGLDVAFAMSSASYNTVTVDQFLFNFWTTVGANIDAAFHFTNRVGLYVGVDFYINLIGLGVYGRDSSSYNSVIDLFYVSPGGFNTDIRVGVSFKF